MYRLLISSLLIAGMSTAIASNAETYNALCDEDNASINTNSSTIPVANCQITLSEKGIKGRIDFITQDTISQWYSIRQDDNLLVGISGQLVAPK